MSFREKVIFNYADRAVQEFDANPVAKGFLRRLAEEHPEMFLNIAMRHLRSDLVSSAHNYLATLAVRHDEITDYLANPSASSREVAQKLFRRFLAVDRSFDVKLARKLPDRYFSNQHGALAGPRATRALDILDHNSQGRRLLPILGHLPNSPDANLAAKGVLFVGRRVQNPTWSSQLLSRPDPRVRANAVEALWGMDTPQAIQLLEQCLEDRNNRVQGNALVGLHMVGRPGVESHVLTLSRTSSPPHRSTAAWVMAKMEQEAWIEVLTIMIRDENQQVRSRALRSLKELRRTIPVVVEEPLAVQDATPDVAVALPEAIESTLPADVPVIPAPLLPELRLDGSSFSVRL